MNLCKFRDGYSPFIRVEDYQAFNSSVDDDYYEKVSLSIVFIDFILSNTVVVLSIFANFIVVYVMLTSKRIRKTSANSFILATLVSDFILACWFFYIMLIFIYTQELPKLFPFTYTCGMVIINIQIAMSADRFWAIRFPISYFIRRESRYERWVIAAAITAGLLGSIPYGLIVILNGYKCDGDHDHNIMNEYRTAFDCWTLISVISVLMLNGSIVYFILKRKQIMQDLFEQNTSELENTREEQDTRITITMLMIMISCCFCWIPFASHDIAIRLSRDDYFFVKFFVDDMNSKKAYLLNVVFTVLAKSAIYLNLLFDPLIYAMRMKVIRDEVRILVSFKGLKSPPETVVEEDGSSTPLNSLNHNIKRQKTQIFSIK